MLKKAFHYSLPIMVSYFFMSITYGLLMAHAGYAWYWSVIISWFIYTGAFQFVFISLLSQHASLLDISLTALFMNSRNAFYALSMSPTFLPLKNKALYLIHTLGDETFMVDYLIKDKEPKATSLMYRVHFLARLSWLSGAALGGLVGSYLAFDLTGIDFCMTAMFITIFVDQFKNKEKRFPQLLGLIIGIICLFIFKSQFMIYALIITTLLLLIRGEL